MKKNDLFNLIKSLSKAEKRYFNLYAKRHVKGENNKYLLIYKVIEKEKEYNEKKIIQNFKSYKFTKRFPVIKSYLYNIILKALNQYYSNNSILAIIKENMKSIEILYKKGLFNQCLELIKTTQKKLSKFELFPYELELIMWKKKLINEIPDMIKSDYYKNILNYERELIKKIANLNDFMYLTFNIFSLTYLKGNTRKELSQKFTKIINTQIMKSPDNTFSKSAKIHFYNLYSEYYKSNKEYDKYYECAKNLYLIINISPFNLQFQREQIISAIFNYIQACYYTSRYKEAKKLIAEIRIKAKTINEKARVFIRSYQIELAIYTNTMELIDINNLNKTIINNFEIYNEYIEHRHAVVLKYQMFYLMFIHRYYKQSLFWLNMLLNDKVEYRNDIKIYSKLGNIFLHYELNNIDLVNYLIDSFKRKHPDFHPKLIKFFEYILKNTNNKENIENIYKQIIKYSEKHEEILEYFNFRLWAISKLKKSSFKEAYNIYNVPKN